MDQFESFLNEYEQLCKKYNVTMLACECHSYHAYKANNEEIELHVEYLKEQGLEYYK